MTGLVAFNSPELVAYHEAGHAEVALAVGARVVRMELYRDPVRSYGKASVNRTEVQAPHIALGGFAAEYRLYRLGLLIKADGNPPTEKEFIQHAYLNSREDRVNFFGGDMADEDGSWPEELDREFMKYAIGRAENKMRWDVVERIAKELLAKDVLDEQEISEIACPTGPADKEP